MCVYLYVYTHKYVSIYMCVCVYQGFIYSALSCDYFI